MHSPTCCRHFATASPQEPRQVTGLRQRRRENASAGRSKNASRLDGKGGRGCAALIQAASRRTQLSSSINEPAFPSRPGITLATVRSVGDGRSRATRSIASMGAPDLPRSEHRGRLTASRVLRLALALLALFEAIAVAVHFEDMDVVGQPIEQRAGQPLGPEHAGPLVERQIAGDEGGAALVTLTEDLEQELRAGRRQGHIAELIDDQQLVTGQLAL